MKALIYARVSTETQEKQQTIESQLAPEVRDIRLGRALCIALIQCGLHRRQFRLLQLQSPQERLRISHDEILRLRRSLTPYAARSNQKPQHNHHDIKPQHGRFRPS